MQSWEKYTPQMLSILRIVACLIFIAHGTQKLWAFPGPLLLVGIYTRWMAFFLSGEMAVAYWYAHFPRNFWPLLNGGDAAILYCFVFLFIACAGVGAWGLDRSVRGTSG
jgi:putative oxidoreductase